MMPSCGFREISQADTILTTSSSFASSKRPRTRAERRSGWRTAHSSVQVSRARSLAEKGLGFFVGHGPQGSIIHGALVPSEPPGGGRRNRSEPGDWHPAADNRDGFAILGQLEEAGELGLGLVDGDFH